MIKSAIAYNILDGYEINIDKIRQNILDKGLIYKDPEGVVASASGWINQAYNEEVDPFISVSGLHVLRYRYAVKDVPSSVVSYEAKRRIEALKEAGEEYPVSKKEIKELEVEVFQEMVPSAFVRVKFEVSIYISPVDGIIFVDSNADKKADEAISFLNKANEEIIKLECFRHNPSIDFKKWIEDDVAENGLVVGSSASFKGAEGRSVNVKKCDLNNELTRYTGSAMSVDKLEFVLDDIGSFMLNTKGHISAISPSDEFKENAASEYPLEADPEDDGYAASMLQAEFLMNREIIKGIVESLK